MTDVTYEIVEHDGGWAYRYGDVFSETFRTRKAAEQAAEAAASEQRVPGETEVIRFQDPQGKWHDEVSSGSDRPETHVAGEAGPRR